MTSTSQTVLSELESSVKNFADGLDRGRTLDVKIVHDESEQLSTLSDISARIGWRDYEPLGRSGVITLEQHICEITLLRRESTLSADRLEADIALAGELSDYLIDNPGQFSRVESITRDRPIDWSAIRSPGLSKIVLIADCDMLLGANEDPLPDLPDNPPLLTAARYAVWDAIDDWQPLGGTFNRKFKTASDCAELDLRDPSLTELPSIALSWSPIQLEWQTNRAQTWPLSLNVTTWTPAGNLATAEKLAEDVIDALYRSAPNAGAPSYIHAATGADPRRIGPIKIESIDLGRSKTRRALRTDISFVLRSVKDPFGDT